MKAMLWTFVILATATASTQAQWKQNGSSARDSADRKSVSGFAAHLMTIKNIRQFVTEWATTPPEHTPRVPDIDSIERKKSLGVVVFFGGCGQDAKGFCKAEVDYVIYRPDGTIYTEQNALDLWKQEAPPVGNIQLGRAILEFAFTDKDPKGEYRIRAKVRDLNAKVEFELERMLVLK
jgi:hypothetical protein